MNEASTRSDGWLNKHGDRGKVSSACLVGSPVLGLKRFVYFTTNLLISKLRPFWVTPPKLWSKRWFYTRIAQINISNQLVFFSEIWTCINNMGLDKMFFLQD